MDGDEPRATSPVRTIRAANAAAPGAPEPTVAEPPAAAPGLTVMRIGAVGASAVLLPLVAGLAAATTGGVAWACAVRWTGYELGFGAWATGALTGFAVGRTSPVRNTLLPPLAAIFALLGVLLGKLLEVAFADHVPVLSAATWHVFSDVPGRLWGVFDLLWVVFALSSAYRLAGRVR